MDTPATNHRLIQQPKLLVSGWIRLSAAALPIEIIREMLVMSQDGQEIGRVAAIVVDNLTQDVTHILLGHLPLSPEYRLVSVDRVMQITGQTVVLQIQSRDVESLTVHRPM